MAGTFIDVRNAALRVGMSLRTFRVILDYNIPVFVINHKQFMKIADLDAGIERYNQRGSSRFGMRYKARPGGFLKGAVSGSN